MREMLKRLVGADPVYARIEPDSLRLRDVGTGKEVEDSPVLAISRDRPRKVIAAGRTASETAAQRRVACDLLNGFDHPRVIISDFVVAEKTLQHFLRELLRPRILRSVPALVIHPLRTLEGGLSQIEVRALQELGAGAGARRVHVWTGRELTDHELKAGTFQRLDGLVDYASSL